MKTFVTAEILAKRLCVHCTHCVTTYPDLMIPQHMCGLKRSQVDDSPQHSCTHTRSWSGYCGIGGFLWEQASSVIVTDDPAAAQHEDWIQTFMETARRDVKAGTRPMATCGGYEEARRRVMAENLSPA